MVRVPRAAGAVIDPGIRKTDPVIARQTALPNGAPIGLPSDLLPVLPTGVANGRLIDLRSGFPIAEAIALLTAALTATQTVPKNASWTAQMIVIGVGIGVWIGLLNVVRMVGIGP